MQMMWRCSVCSAGAGILGALVSLFNGLLFDLGPFDLSARRQTLIAQNTQCLDLRTLTTSRAVFKDFEIAWARHAVFVHVFGSFGLRSPQNKQLSNVLNGRRIQLVCQVKVHGLAKGAIVT
jgi:hypothetical protein